MRTHTALHILCAVVWRDYGAKVTGANMEPLRGRMDFEFEHLSGDFVRELEERVNVEVAAARPTRVDFLAREEADQRPGPDPQQGEPAAAAIRVVRVVGIEGLDLQADGGTHVADTSEVGRIALPSYKSKGRINKRIELALDKKLRVPSRGMAMGDVHRPVDKRPDFPAMEQRVLERWREDRTFERSLAAREGGPTFSFSEGPPTANGDPGSHHVLLRSFKDTYLRYKTMRGFHAPRKAGWDCHGLPVELRSSASWG